MYACARFTALLFSKHFPTDTRKRSTIPLYLYIIIYEKMDNEPTTLLVSVSKTELEVIVREACRDAVKDAEIERQKQDRFAHLPANLTKKQAAEFLGVSPGTIGNYHKDGKLNGVKLGRSIRFPKEEIIRIVMNGGLKYRR